MTTASAIERLEHMVIEAERQADKCVEHRRKRYEMIHRGHVEALQEGIAALKLLAHIETGCKSEPHSQ